MPASSAVHSPKLRTRTIAEIGLMLALYVVLDLAAVHLPINVAGGSISLAMVPIMLYAIVRGPALGTLMGALAGGLDMMVQPYFVHPAQVALDYVVAYALVGLGAGILSRHIVRSYVSGSAAQTSVLVVAAGLLAGAFRLAAHFGSGVVFFSSYAPEGQAAWLYSLVYNLSYVGPSAAISTLVVVAAVRPVLRALNVGGPSAGGR